MLEDPKKNLGFDTRAAHIGKESAQEFGVQGNPNTPVYYSSTFAQKVPGTWESFTYTRTNNPTEEALRRSMAEIENGKHGVIFSSGLAAIQGVMELLSSGDHVVSTADIYGGTHRLFSDFIQKRGIEFTFLDTTELKNVEAAFKPNTKMVYVESPSNPLLTVSDLKAISKLAHDRGARLVVDNTLATPYLQTPLDLGADIVLGSSSKYLSGHTNVVGGYVAVKETSLYDELKFIRKATGGNPGPQECFSTILGLKTLGLRMRAHESNAMAIAKHLSGHAHVKKVYYPGLPEHPQHELAKEQMSGFGGIVSFELDGTEEQAVKFVTNLALFSLAVSFGSVSSLVDYPALMSHKDMPKEERRARGFDDGLIRLSPGIENEADLINALDSAFAKAFA